MFKTTVRAKSFFDDEVTTHTLYFNLSRREVFELAKEYNGVNAFQEYITNAQADENLFQIVEFTDNIIGKAYGERQGERFVKSEQIKESFLNSPEYEELFDQLMDNPSLVREFYNGILPEKIMKQVQQDPKYKELDSKLKETELNNL